jgi:hypothetical protein
MEVHHHAHTSDPGLHRGRKKWTHYFWEFFMLFMAVTLGFFVENQREHYVGYIREKQYMSAAGKDENVIKAYRYTYPALNNITFAF